MMECVYYSLGEDGPRLGIAGGSVPEVGGHVVTTEYRKGATSLLCKWRVESVSRELLFSTVDGERRGAPTSSVFVTLVRVEE